MKKITIFLSLVLTVLFLSCKQEKVQNISYTIEQTRSSDLLNEYKTYLGHVIRDSLEPQYGNERVDITDEKGLPIAVAGRASEIYKFNLVKYLYDEKGNVSGFLCRTTNEAEENNYDVIDGEMAYEEQFDFYETTEEPLYEKKALFDMVFTKDNDEPYFERYYFKRDSMGRIIKVYDPILHKSITAYENWHIEYKIEEDENFWTSDIQGGKIWLTLTFKPNSDNEEGEEMEKRKYYGYVDSRDM